MATTPNTQNPSNTRPGGRSLFRLLSALLALALFASACGSAGSDTAEAVSDAVAGDDDKAMEDDEESSFVESFEEETTDDDEEAMEDEEGGGGSAPETRASADAADEVLEAAAEETADGAGLFGTCLLYTSPSPRDS